MRVSLVVPWRHTPDRAPGWDWLYRRWMALSPRWEILVADSSGREWCKPAAVNAAARAATGDVLVVADADCIVDHATIRAAVHAAYTDAAWVVPHRRVHRLTRSVTERLLTRPPGVALPREPGPTMRRPIVGVAGGGLFVIRRDAYWAAGGMDERFVGWGGEDTAFACAADTLVGEHVRLDAPLVHLWHKPGPRKRHPGWRENLERTLSYMAARGDTAAMRALVGT